MSLDHRMAPDTAMPSEGAPEAPSATPVRPADPAEEARVGTRG